MADSSRTRIQDSLLVSWCFEPSQPQRITSELNTNFTLSPSHSFHKSSYYKSCFCSLFIFHGHSTGEPASSRVTYFILPAYTGTSVSHSQQEKIRVRNQPPIKAVWGSCSKFKTEIYQAYRCLSCCFVQSRFQDVANIEVSHIIIHLSQFQ